MNNIRIFLVKNLPLPVRKVIRKLRSTQIKTYKPSNIISIIKNLLIYIIKVILNNIRIFLVNNLPLPIRKQIRKLRKKFNW